MTASDQEPASALPRGEDSLRKRYVFKLGANAISVGISILTQTMVPRALGPVGYGNFGFLTNFFTQIIEFLDSGVSIGFYNKLSHRSDESGLIRFNWGFIGLIGLLTTAFVAFVQGAGLGGRLWSGQAVYYVWMAVLYSFLFKVVQITGQIVDAQGLTVGGEMSRLLQRVLGLAALSLLFWMGRLGLTSYFLCQYFLILCLLFFWRQVLNRKGVALFPSAPLGRERAKAYAREMYSYASPLMVSGLVALGVGLLDRWILQTYAGAAEQGFYTLSYQIGAVCFLFTNAMTPLLMREFAKAFGEKDRERLRTLFRRHIPMLYAVAAFFSAFFAVQSENVAWLLGGSAFHGASAAITVMAFYPMHQTYGQLSGSLFYATERTRLYRNIGVTFMFLGLPATLWLIAPMSWGLHLGATGLAVKSVVMNLLEVNVQLWFNSRYLDIPFGRLLWHQVYSVGLLAGVAVLSSHCAGMAVQGALPELIVSGALYTAAAGLLVLLVPSLFAVSRQDLARLWRQGLVKAGLS